MSFDSAVSRYRRVEEWFDDHPFVHVVVLAAVIGSSWAISSVLITDQPLSAAARFGLVAGISAFVVAGLAALIRR